MKISQQPPLGGDKIKYDMELQPSAERLLEHLKSRPTFRWFNRFLCKPETLQDSGQRIQRASGSRYGPFLGAPSYLCRNAADPISQQIFAEMRRVYGRELELHELILR